MPLWCAVGGVQPTPCVGDCNGDERVAVNELVTAVSIALSALPLGACLAADPDGDERVTVAELVAAVNSALYECGVSHLRIRRHRQSR